VLIRQDKAEIQTSFREEINLWRNKEFIGIKNDLHLRSVNLNIPLKTIYKRVTLSP